jgi:hypothetical protein
VMSPKEETNNWEQCLSKLNKGIMDI